MEEKDATDTVAIAPEEPEEFGELLKYTAAGFGGGLLLAGAFDSLGLQRSGLAQWAVRTLSGGFRRR